MTSFSSRQWITVAGGIALFALLFFINKKEPASKTEGAPMAGGHAANQAESFDTILSQAESQVPASFDNRIRTMKQALTASSAGAEQEAALNALVDLYDSMGAHIPATFYTEKLAMLKNSTELWFQAGDRYYKSAEVMNNASRGTILEKAEACFNKALQLDSTFLDAKVGYAECIVQGENPMQGIGIIEGVLKKDSNNEKAQVALGEFSIQSGQYPKAIMRFNKVLKIDPTYTEAYLYLAQAYESSGDTGTAIINLKKYSTFAEDSTVKEQVNNYIKKLEKR